MNKILSLVHAERRRQAETLMLIPSENYTYPEVHQAVGSCLMHKYAEGYPQRRYYQGNSIVDQIESLCRAEALKTFSLSPQTWGVNVQPHSGSEANIAVYNALLAPGDKILSMCFYDGGHLSHGWQYKNKKLTLVSKFWNVEFYHVDPDTQVLDYHALLSQAKAFRPKLLISGGTAYPRELSHAKMGRIADTVGAYYLADVSHEAGLIAGDVNKSPFRYADVVTMTTHKTLRGPRGALIFARRNLLDSVNTSVFPGLQGGPHLHTIAGIALALQKAQTSDFSAYAHQTLANARALAKALANHRFTLVSGGTDKHLLLVDLRTKNTNGWFVAWALESAGIVVNRNAVPADTGSPYYPSGLRLGTPAVTVRGMGESEMIKIASWINAVVNHLGPGKLPRCPADRAQILKHFRAFLPQDKFLCQINAEVRALCRQFPA